MTTGELEYTNLPLDAFPVSSHLLYVCFVFLIVLVLMNLLSGLAVSDIQKIRDKAKIVSSRSRVELVTYIECVLLGSPLHQISLRSLCHYEGRKEKGICSIEACPELLNPAKQLLNRLGRRTLIFQKCLQANRSISVFPNCSKDRWIICDCHRFQLEEAQIEAAKDKVLEKQTAANQSNLESRLDQLTDAVLSLTKEKVDKQVHCPSPQ